MTDSYLDFANSLLGARLTTLLGLPQPVPLPRHQAGRADIEGPLLIGAGPGASVLPALAACLAPRGVATLAHASAARWIPLANQAALMTGRWNTDGDKGVKVRALVFDATGLETSEQSDALYAFFHDTARSVLPGGRVLVIGRPPESCADPRRATVQRALEGLVRSLGKELKRGISANLLYLAPDAETQMDSTLAFLLSPRSAYVSGQVVRLAPVTGEAANAVLADPARPLAGRRMLVTGASRGIGEAIAEVLARDGADLVLLDVPQAQAGLEAVAQRLGARALALDIGAPEAPQALVDAARADGGWDGLVHNAGITRDKTIANMKPAFWEAVVNVNLSTQERINAALVESGALRAGGRIVCVSSISGIAGNLGQTNYAFSKAGVIGMVHSQAPHLAARGITINAVAPGFIETQMTAAVPFAIREAGRRMNSMGQGGLPVDVAETIAWMASPASQALTGNVVRVCGQSLLGA